MTDAPKAHQPTPHIYDDDDLGPRLFLEAVMHDPRTNIRHRMKAASQLLELYPDIYNDAAPAILYRIEGMSLQ